MNLFSFSLLYISLILGDHEKQRTIQKARKQNKTNTCWDCTAIVTWVKQAFLVLASHPNGTVEVVFRNCWEKSSTPSPRPVSRPSHVPVGGPMRRCMGSQVFISALISFLVIESLPKTTGWANGSSTSSCNTQFPCCPMNWTNRWAVW